MFLAEVTAVSRVDHLSSTIASEPGCLTQLRSIADSNGLWIVAKAFHLAVGESEVTHSTLMCAATWFAITATLSPVQAQEPGENQGQEIVVTGKKSEKDVVTQAVPIGDLDLATDTGAKEMEKRVASAVDYICAIPAVIGYYKQKSEAPCRDEAWTGARPQMENAMQKARAVSN
jgi:UrcA family protein